MTTAAQLLREVENMPESAAVEVLNFAMFIKTRHSSAQPIRAVNHTVPMIKDAHGIFRDLKGIDATIERDEEDRI